MIFFTRIEKQNQQYLAIRTGMKAGAKGIQKLYQDGLPQGYIIRDNQVTTWHSNGWHTQDNEIFLYGEYRSGTELSAIWNQDPVNGIRIIRQLHTALCTARNANSNLPVLSYHSVYLLDDGGFLFIPRRVAETIHSYLSPEESLEEVDALSHPGCTMPEHQHGFTLLSLLYSIICGEQPFAATSSLERTSLLTHYSVIPPHFFQPQIPLIISEEIATALMQPTEKMPTASKMESLLDTIQTAAEQNKLQFPPQPVEQLDKERKKRAYRYRMHAGIEANKGRLLLLAASIVVVATLFVTRTTSPSDSSGHERLSAGDTVELFYESFNTLDHLVMDEITARGVASQEIREVMHMNLSSRLQRGYFQIDGIVTPQQYLAGVDLTETQQIYGISDLTIDRKPLYDSTNGKQAFQVSFIHWSPQMHDDIESEILVSDIQRIKQYNRTTVEKSNRDRWIITSITTESTEELEPIKRKN